MELIHQIRNDTLLAPYLADDCTENDICATIEETVNREQLVIIKVDDYYNSLGLGNTPPSIDCLIIQYCSDNQYQVHLVELKNVAQPRAIDSRRLEQKYETTLLDFMSNRFRSYFFDSNYQLKPKLVLIAAHVQQQKLKTYSLDFLMGCRVFSFQNKLLAIHGYPSDLTIKNCS